jgi:trehalose-6-phosphate synthase
LEKYPEFIGNFTFVEIGAPSRIFIKRYHDLGAELDGEAERINRRFQKHFLAAPPTGITPPLSGARALTAPEST